MRRALCSLITPLSVALLWGSVAAPGVLAAESAAAPAAAVETPARSSAVDEDPAASPWEHPLWHNATTMMRIYLCEHSRRPPSWCAAPRELPANIELPAEQGPPLHEGDALWLAFLDQADPENLSAEDVATIRRRAVERRDPQAMEILGFLYAEGRSVALDYAESYRWYGLAYLSGETRVRANMDVVWQQLQRHDLEGALALTRQFDALAAGQMPEDLLTAAELAPGATPTSPAVAPASAFK